MSSYLEQYVSGCCDGGEAAEAHMKTAQLNPESRPASFSSVWRGLTFSWHNKIQRLNCATARSQLAAGKTYKYVLPWCALYLHTSSLTSVYSSGGLLWKHWAAVLSKRGVEKPLGTDIDSLFPWSNSLFFA